MNPRKNGVDKFLFKLYHALLIVLMFIGVLLLLFTSTSNSMYIQLIVSCIAGAFSASIIIQTFVGDDYED